MLKLFNRLGKGGVAGELLLQSIPKLRLAHHPGHGFLLGVRARRRLQASKLLV